MKRVVMLFLVIILLVSFSEVSLVAKNQFFQKIKFKAGGGLVLPNGELADELNTGTALHASGAYSFPDSQLSLIGGIEALSFKYDGGSLTTLIVFVDARYTFESESKTIFFIEAGLGNYYFIFKDRDWPGSESGIRIGAGVKFGNMEVTGMLHKSRYTDYDYYDASVLSVQALYRF